MYARSVLTSQSIFTTSLVVFCTNATPQVSIQRLLEFNQNFEKMKTQLVILSLLLFLSIIPTSLDERNHGIMSGKIKTFANYIRNLCAQTHVDASDACALFEH